MSDAEFAKTGLRPNFGVPIIENAQGGHRHFPEFLKNEVESEIDMVSTMLATYLRLPRSQDREGVDLTDSALWECDLSGANLSGSNLNNMYFYHAKLEDADLSAITKFSNSAWVHTAWWRAKVVSVELLNYLETSYPYDPKTYRGNVATTRADYNQNILRLKALTKAD